MAEIIDRKITDDEILVRFIFEGDFKKNSVCEANIIDKNIFIDTHNKGVSLQRERYADENECKKIGKNIPHKFVGFVIFKKKSFNVQVEEHVKQRGDFEAVIISTPLDENLKVIPEQIEVSTDTPLLPAHADIIYINPASELNDESPHTFKRVFSKNLYKDSIVLIDHEFDSEEFDYIKFKEAFA